MPELISGIFNYCDRWCERCDYTDQCRLFQSEAERNIKHILNDEDMNDPKVFAKDIADSLTEALSMLKDQIDKEGISEEEIEDMDYDDIDFNDEPANESMNEQRITRITHPLITQADEFFKSIDSHYNSSKNVNSIDNAESSSENKLIDEYRARLFWYSPQIAVKTRMCLMEKEKLIKIKSKEIEEEILNVNSRIAFTGMEKCFEALNYLYNTHEDSPEILTLLSKMKKLKDDFVNEFPMVLDYKRPYFD